MFVIQENKTFEELFESKLINNRFHKILVKTIADIFAKDKNIVIKEKLTIKSKPNIIIFKKQIFPVKEELNICNSWKDVLEIHRRERTLDPKNYLPIKNKILKLCNNREDNFKYLEKDNEDTVEKEIKL